MQDGSSAGELTEVPEFSSIRFIFSSMTLAAGSISLQLLFYKRPDRFMIPETTSLAHSSS